MFKSPYVAPSVSLKAFNCPHCNAYSVQYSFSILLNTNPNQILSDWNYKICDHCTNEIVFYKEKMIIPNTGGGPSPNPDLPKDVINDYIEAMTVINLSPRSAAALLRLALQKLCVHLGEKGANINDDIKSLVKKGLPEKIQKALDAIRLVGNQAVHPGEMDLTDDTETVSTLFKLINFIGDYMITKPNEVDSFYSDLPENKRKEIENRDKKK